MAGVVILVGLDLGSKHLGLAVVDTTQGEALPLHMDEEPALRWVVVPDEHAPRTLDVDPAALASAVLRANEAAVAAGADAFVVEHAPWFPRAGSSPGGLKRSQEAWLVTHDLLDALRRASPIPVHVIARQTWAHRVVPHHRGGVTDAHVLVALPALLDPASLALLTDTHQRDAAGAVLGYLLAPQPKAPRAPRVEGAPGRRKRRKRSAKWVAARTQARAEARQAAGCTPTTCPAVWGGHGGRHGATCPLHRPKRVPTCPTCLGEHRRGEPHYPKA